MKVLFFVVLAFCITCSYGQSYLPLDDASMITFKIKNVGLTVNGRIKGLAGRVILAKDDPSQNSASLTLRAGTIDTGISLRDKHLRKEEYFHVQQYPQIAFESVRFFQDTKAWNVEGNLSIKNTTKRIVIKFSQQHNTDGTINLKGNFAINRREFSIGGKSLTMADEVEVDFNILLKSLDTAQ